MVGGITGINNSFLQKLDGNGTLRDTMAVLIDSSTDFAIADPLKDSPVLKEQIAKIINIYKADNPRLPQSIESQLILPIMLYIQICQIVTQLAPKDLVEDSRAITQLIQAYAMSLRLAGVTGEQKQVKMVAHHHLHRIAETARNLWEIFRSGLIECHSEAVKRGIITQEQSSLLSAIIKDYFKKANYGVSM